LSLCRLSDRNRVRHATLPPAFFGLFVSFSLLILAGSEVISLLHLPQNSLRDAGIVLLAVVGARLPHPAAGPALRLHLGLILGRVALRLLAAEALAQSANQVSRDFGAWHGDPPIRG